MSDILAAIIATKHQEVTAALKLRPEREVVLAAKAARPARDFLQALSLAQTARIIAECKRQSPSRGVMRDPYDPVALAQAYQAGGAAAISVLTDRTYFGGALEHLTAVSQAVTVPVLRKDFIVHPYQIYEARAAGADTFLLIAGVLSTLEMEQFIQLGRSLGMEPLLESHTAGELELALATSGKIFGVNNRNLKTFGIDLATATALVATAKARRPGAVMVCESGIKTAADIKQMQGAGYPVFLVGEALVTHQDPTAAVRALVV